MLARTTNQSISGANTFMNKIASIMPSGYAGFTTRTSTQSAPMPKP